MTFLRKRLAILGGVAAALVVAVIVVAIYSLLFCQNLEVEQTDTGVVLDARSLGEYQANATEITLTDVQSQQVVWQIKAKHRFFSLFTIALGVGFNAANPDREAIDVLVPSSAPYFELTNGREYEFVLRSLVEVGEAETRRRFTLPNLRARPDAPPDARNPPVEPE